MNQENTRKMAFQRIALMGREGVPGVAETLHDLIAYLQQSHRHVVLESTTASILKSPHHEADVLSVSAHDLHQHADLLIVVGGDGSLLNAAHIALANQLPILGINRGRLGFLTDIPPTQLDKINAILEGHYQTEKRCLLQATLQHHTHTMLALNDIVLLPADAAQMIEFDLLVNEQFVCHHRADGMIIATPTGSTAYALSGGGPILYPSLQAMVLVPMFPHTLSSRPIVISDESIITISITDSKPTTHHASPYLSADGQKRIAVNLGEKITIQKNSALLELVHPLSYNYFHTLREKLHWEKQATRDRSS